MRRREPHQTRDRERGGKHHHKNGGKELAPKSERDNHKRERVGQPLEKNFEREEEQPQRDRANHPFPRSLVVTHSPLSLFFVVVADPVCSFHFCGGGCTSPRSLCGGSGFLNPFSLSLSLSLALSMVAASPLSVFCGGGGGGFPFPSRTKNNHPWNHVFFLCSMCFVDGFLRHVDGCHNRHGQTQFTHDKQNCDWRQERNLKTQSY